MHETRDPDGGNKLYRNDGNTLMLAQKQEYMEVKLALALE